MNFRVCADHPSMLSGLVSFSDDENENRGASPVSSRAFEAKGALCHAELIFDNPY